MIKKAVIDIGSSIVKMLMATVNAQDEVISRERFFEPTALGEDLKKTGVLKQDKIDLTVKAVSEFYDKAKTQCSEIHVIATEAVRSAKNKDLFLFELSKKGIQVVIIDADMEAEITFLGASEGHANRVLCIDIGGASTEIVVGEASKLIYRKSLKIGTRALRDLFELNKRESIAYVATEIKGYGSIPQSDVYFAVSGAARSATKIINYTASIPINDTHNKIISCEKLVGIIESIIDLTPEQLFEKYPYIGKLEAQVTVFGLILLSSIMRYLGIENAIMSDRDGLDGYLIMTKIGRRLV